MEEDEKIQPIVINPKIITTDLVQKKLETIQIEMTIELEVRVAMIREKIEINLIQQAKVLSMIVMLADSQEQVVKSKQKNKKCFLMNKD